MSEVLTVSDVARELRRSVDTIRDWSERGKLPCQRTAAGWRVFKREDVERARSQWCRPVEEFSRNA